MELVEGLTLAERIESGRFPWRKPSNRHADRRGLEYAHERRRSTRFETGQHQDLAGDREDLDFAAAKALSPFGDVRRRQ